MIMSKTRNRNRVEIEIERGKENFPTKTRFRGPITIPLNNIVC